MPITFSTHPGAWERQLQRKHRNPLYSAGARAATAAQLKAARRRDEEERRDFGAALQATLREALELPPHVESDVLLKLKERLDQLYDRCAALPGDHDREKRSLTRMIDVIMSAIRAGAGDDPRAHAELDQEEQARTLHHRLLQQPLIAQLLRPDSPVADDELVPTLLSEDEEVIRTVLLLFDPPQLDALCHEARALLERLRAEGQTLPEAWQRLALMDEAARPGTGN